MPPDGDSSITVPDEVVEQMTEVMIIHLAAYSTKMANLRYNVR
jgi:hypothetical protein